MIRIKVLKLAGETGLRRPGTVYSEYDQTAAYLIGKGFAEIADKVIKEDKTPIETKEKKFTRQTKKHQ